MTQASFIVLLSNKNDKNKISKHSRKWRNWACVILGNSGLEGLLTTKQSTRLPPPLSTPSPTTQSKRLVTTITHLENGLLGIAFQTVPKTAEKSSHEKTPNGTSKAQRKAKKLTKTLEDPNRTTIPLNDPNTKDKACQSYIIYIEKKKTHQARSHSCRSSANSSPDTSTLSKEL